MGGEGVLVYYAFVECYLVCGTALVEFVFLSWCTVYSAGQYWILARANIQYWPADYTAHQ